MAARRSKIRFYVALKKRVADPAWPAGNIPIDWLLDGAPTKFEPATGETIQADAPGLSQLTYGEQGTAYVNDPDAAADDPDPDVLFAEVATRTDELLHLRVWRVRRSQLPSLHDMQDGSTTAMELTRTQGIAEAIDVLLFSSGVVGWLVNRAGPSQSKVLRYLENRTAVNMKLVLLHREDALDLVRGDRVSSVDVEVASGHFEALANVTPEIGTAAAAVNTPGLRTIRVSFGAEREERGSFWQWWRPRARRLIGLGRDEVTRLDVTHVRSGELSAQTVNLLSEAIGLETSVETQTGRTSTKEDARRAIIDGFNLLVDVIGRATDQLDAAAENQRTERKKPSPLS